MKKDKTLACEDCQQEFVWTVGEQEFYAGKGLAQPKYCLICRGKYKAREAHLGKYGKRRT